VTGPRTLQGGPRLPVAPPPGADELLPSWLGRVGCRYGQGAHGFVLWLTEASGPAPALAILAEASGLEPERLAASTLGAACPHRPATWFLFPAEALVPRRPPQVCPACLAEDGAAGRDAYLRRAWALSERCVCTRHRCFLTESCPQCRAPLGFTFILTRGHARLICPACAGELADGGRGGEAASDRPQAATLDVLTAFEERIGALLEDPSRWRTVAQIEDLCALLWSPLGTTREPLLALWFDDPPRLLGRALWSAPTDAPRPAEEGPIRAPAALGAPLRALTLVAAAQLSGVAGAEWGPPPLGLAELVRRLGPRASRDLLERLDRWPLDAAEIARSASTTIPARPSVRAERPGVHIPRRAIPLPGPDYARLARDILASPEFMAAADASDKAREKLLGRLMWKAFDGRSEPLSGHPA
jgi:hypothetical protein